MSVQDDNQNFCLKALNQRVISLGGVDGDRRFIDADWKFDALGLVNPVIGLICSVAFRPRMNCGLWNSSPFRTQSRLQSASADLPQLARNLFAGGASDEQTPLHHPIQDDVDHRAIAHPQTSRNADKTLRLNFDRLGFNGQGLPFWVENLQFHPSFSCAQFFLHPKFFTSISASFVSHFRRSIWAK